MCLCIFIHLHACFDCSDSGTGFNCVFFGHLDSAHSSALDWMQPAQRAAIKCNVNNMLTLTTLHTASLLLVWWMWQMKIFILCVFHFNYRYSIDTVLFFIPSHSHTLALLSRLLFCVHFSKQQQQPKKYPMFFIPFSISSFSLSAQTTGCCRSVPKASLIKFMWILYQFD
jgi:hypothetical protein